MATGPATSLDVLSDGTKYLVPSASNFEWPSTTERGWASFTSTDCTAERPDREVAETGRSMSLSTPSGRNGCSKAVAACCGSGRWRSDLPPEEDSVGRGFPSILGLAVVVLFQSNLFQNSLEARLLPHAVVNRVNR